MNCDRANKGTKIQKLSQTAKDNMSALAALASKGEQEAAAELYSAVTLATDFLSWLARKKPDIFSAIAATKLVWPVLYGPHSEDRDQANQLIERLRLGAKTGINVSSVGKPFSWRKPANVIAYNLLQLARALQRAPIPSSGLHELARCGVGRTPSGAHKIDDNYDRQLMELEIWGQSGAGSRLPPLSRSTAEQWARETPAFFRLVFGKKFENHPCLQELKHSVLGSAKDASGKPGGIGIVRKLMLQKVKQALRSSIAPLD